MKVQAGDAPALTDDELMLLVARGKRDACAVLAERHHERVLNFIYRLTGDREHARDLSQECFLRLFRGAERYQARGKFAAFLYTLALNAVRQRARRRREDEWTSLDALADRTSDQHAIGPERQVEIAELNRRLNRALAALTDDQREVFVLSELEGRRYREIAEILGCPEGTVASRKHDAVVRLRALLADWRS